MIISKTDVKAEKVINGNFFQLINPQNSKIENFDISILEVDPGKSGKKHYHKSGEEVFYILDGKGKINIDDQDFSIQKGDCINIERGQPHYLKNDSSQKLVVLLINSPPLSDADHYLI
ncbi:cupin domain-containing protein [Candidatus Neomarinimicrobiota bacterium]